MPTRIQRLVKIIESDNAAELETKTNSFLDTVDYDNLKDIHYKLLQTPIGTLYTTMIVYKQYSDTEGELK
ncbi:hypothetical protein [Mucilaginibacter rubeus]|uniref:Uncharacterized protein n=1 Tax=Mucilaginibacter rubeus TaxID=2027860 RepID=A0A5C1HSX7_9SPHI|nr:hypothetical protein [Mucilaginibacter rubeus]QEM09127.1 hypothetical protein DEO27_003545 [Mucilaginibacter rubeus]